MKQCSRGEGEGEGEGEGGREGERERESARARAAASAWRSVQRRLRRGGTGQSHLRIAALGLADGNQAPGFSFTLSLSPFLFLSVSLCTFSFSLCAFLPAFILRKSQVVYALLDHSQDLIALSEVRLDDPLSSWCLRDTTKRVKFSEVKARESTLVYEVTHRSSLLGHFLLLRQMDLNQLSLENLQLV